MRLIFLLILIVSNNQLQAAPRKGWTYMFYLDAYDLLSGVCYSRDCLATHNKDDAKNIVLQLDNLEKKSIERYRVTRDGLTTVTHLSPYLTKFDVRNSEHIVEFCSWAIEEYPADHYALIFGGHGQGISSEDLIQPTKYRLLQRNYLQPAIERVAKVLGKKIDLIAFDSCCMADIGTMEMCSNYAEYLVASQATVHYYGFPYRKIFPELLADISTMSLMRQVLTDFIEYNALTHSEGTLSILNLSKTNELSRWFHDFFQLLTVAMDDSRIAIIIRKARAQCSQYEDNGSIDLSTFLRNFTMHFAADNQVLNFRSPFFDLLMLYASKGVYLISHIVEGSFATYHAPYAHGISITFPQKQPHRFSPDLTKPWHLFLSKFYSYKEKKSPEISLEAL